MKWTIRIAGVIILSLVILIGIYTYKGIRLKKETWVELKLRSGRERNSACLTTVRFVRLYTHHRSQEGFIVNLIAVLKAYSYLPKKPSLNLEIVDQSLALAC